MPEVRKFDYDERRKEITITATRSETFKEDQIRNQYESLVNTRVNLEQKAKHLRGQIKELPAEITAEQKKLKEELETIQKFMNKENFETQLKQTEETLSAYKSDLMFLKRVVDKLPKK